MKSYILFIIAKIFDFLVFGRINTWKMSKRSRNIMQICIIIAIAIGLSICMSKFATFVNYIIW